MIGGKMIKALTICQPHAFFVALPESDPRHKRVENRTWRTTYRGDLAIHAGMSRAWLGDTEWAYHPADLVFGAIIAIARLVECIRLQDLDDLSSGLRPRRSRLVPPLPLGPHPSAPHTCGPYCWVLSDILVLEQPIPAMGRQGLWHWTPPGPLRFRSAPSVPSVASV
jgi:hypothetical protein